MKNLTQKVIAEQLGISVTCYAGYEQGYRDPDLKTIDKMATLFDVTVDYLIGREDDFGVSAAATDRLAANEQELLSCFRQLSPYLQGVALNAVRGWAGMPPKEDKKQNKS